MKIFIFLYLSIFIFIKYSSQTPCLVNDQLTKGPILLEISYDALPFEDADDTAISNTTTPTFMKAPRKVKAKPKTRKMIIKSSNKNYPCNNDTLKKILKTNIIESPSIAKRAIYHTALTDMNEPFNVICSEHSFSILVNANLYCQDTIKHISCLIYK
uniref:Ground-like domain-containing protein n=1 Tax=Rhabditophanes sp. KR3021 TaxID=114890 RepID=A0AC35U1E1_9BILA